MKNGGGYYDNQGKQGKWIELTNNFFGAYKNGKRVGRWDFQYRETIYQQFELIGGGSYDNQEGSESFRIGKWFEPSDGFHSNNQVMYVGEYQKGIRVGKWEVYMIMDDYGSIHQIGFGEYDDGQEDESRLGMKQGKWHELSSLLQSSSKVIYFGEYKNDIKIGRWEIYWKEKDEKSFKLIGGGLYEDKIDGQFPEAIKQGRWVELNEGFRNSSLLTWKGDYQNNNKIGRWNTSFGWKNMQKQYFQHFSFSGGGSYYEIDIGLTKKVGKLIEFGNRFDRDNQLSCRGEYENGKKKLVDGIGS
ncbi:unnamed protein product [Paramecium octaurelia]|uniref:Uncharacterized protein n=1 Tax=Paramecium octaurelia TaxID=43137 RepID=A0A8S1T454_PAROT|nr:unnamed protein product [Paramecium octaurelia]